MEVKIVKIGNTTTVFLEDGNVLQKDGITQEQQDILKDSPDEDTIFRIMDPEYLNTLEEVKLLKNLLDRVTKSTLLDYDFQTKCIYWREVSPLSIPVELAESILDSEETDDESRLTAYKNFWTLMSLNPDEQCRKNLYWFLKRNGLVISRSGFFIAYRNAQTTDVEGVYTDAHSGTFTIKIGEVVSMKREDCDCDSEVTCSRGLHLGSRDWLPHNYFGNQGLVCLCNPADVVAVPRQDFYGKLRCCAYLPIEKAYFDINDKVIPFNEKDGFVCKYLTKAVYEGMMGTESSSEYSIVIPNTFNIREKENIRKNIFNIAKECIQNREI